MKISLIVPILFASILAGCSSSKKVIFCQTVIGPVQAPSDDYPGITAERAGSVVYIRGPGFRDVVPFTHCLERTVLKK